MRFSDSGEGSDEETKRVTKMRSESAARIRYGTAMPTPIAAPVPLLSGVDSLPPGSRVIFVLTLLTLLAFAGNSLRNGFANGRRALGGRLGQHASGSVENRRDYKE